jgi:hypothetical protein
LFAIYWPFVAKKKFTSIFLVIHLPTILHPCQLSFHPSQPKFSFILATEDQLDVHHSFSLASKAEEAPKLPQKEKQKQTRRKQARPSAAAAAFFRRRGFLAAAAAAACAAVVDDGGLVFSSRFFQQPSSRV